MGNNQVMVERFKELLVVCYNQCAIDAHKGPNKIIANIRDYARKFEKEYPDKKGVFEKYVREDLEERFPKEEYPQLYNALRFL